MLPVVILGFGAAGASAVAALREAGYAGPITVVADGESRPYSPVLASYYAGGRIAREQCFVWSDLNLEGMVDEMRSNARVESIAISTHEVELADGARISYSKLLIATGAHPIAPGFPKSNGYQPLTLRTLGDADRLRRALMADSCDTVLISGTSMVGLKALEACLDRGVHPTLLGRSPHILRSSAHPAIAERFEQLLAERGVTLLLGKTAIGVESSRDGCEVTFDDGSAKRYGEIILAQGVKPNLDFIGGELEAEGGVSVDAFMRTAAPDVFAAGDVARALDISTGQKRIIGLWHNAVQQGRCAGYAIADELAGRTPSRAFPGSLPCNIIHVRDILFASIGSLEQREGRRFDVQETADGLRVSAYDGEGAARRLVGFNALTTVTSQMRRDAFDQDIGTYRREIMNAYL